MADYSETRMFAVRMKYHNFMEVTFTDWALSQPDWIANHALKARWRFSQWACKYIGHYWIQNENTYGPEEYCVFCHDPRPGTIIKSRSGNFRHK